MTEPVWNRLAGLGAVTRNVAWTVCPVSTAGKVVAEVGVTDQPDGTCRPRLTCLAARSPLSVNVSVAVAGWPPLIADRPVRFMVPLGGACAGLGSGLTRYSATPCGGTLALIVPAVSVVWWDHRSFRK